METRLDVPGIESPLFMQFEDEFRKKVGSVVLSSEEASALFTQALKDALNESDVTRMVKEAAQASILSCVRGYFVHGDGRLMIDSAVKRVVQESPIMQAIRGPEPKSEPKKQSLVCHVCGTETLYACSDCRVEFGVSIGVCRRGGT